MTYSINNLVADLRTARQQEFDEQSMLAAAKLAVDKVMTDGSWIKPEYRTYDEALRYGDVLLHEDDDHSFAVFAIAWAPGATTPPHDHAPWVVIATAEGEEVNTLWAPDSEGGGYERSKIINVPAGEMIGLTGDDIHSVDIPGDTLTLSLHVYGTHPDHTARSQFNPETGDASTYTSDNSVV